MPGRNEQPIGRDEELGLVDEFLEGIPSGLTGLLVQGDAGSGKTTLWRAGIERAEERAYRVLSSRPSAAESNLSFSVLGDLVREVMLDDEDELPEPQRRSLKVALLLVEPEDTGPNALAVALAVRGVLGRLARVAPVVVAVDDVQWVDGPSFQALDFALRRSG